MNNKYSVFFVGMFLLQVSVVYGGAFIVDVDDPKESRKNYEQPANIYRVNENNVKSIYDVKIENLTVVYVNRVNEDGTMIVDIYNPPEGLNERERVVMLGIASVETGGRRNNRPGLSRNGNQNFPEEAYSYMKQIVEKQFMYLAFDWELRDRRESLLAYVFFKSGGDLNGILIRQGLARMDNRYVYQFEEQFEKFENSARVQRYGVWR
jgi:endonuclease YncB( thermonuclease family)